jgi:RNA polymerase sigma-70 factor (ECF subfamily)
VLADLPSDELLRICLSEPRSPAWEVFVRRFHPVIVNSVTRISRNYGLISTAVIEDLVQEVYVRICDNRCRVLREFRGFTAEALFPFLKVVSTNVARDRCKALLSVKSGGGKVVPMMDEVSSPESEAGDEAAHLEVLVSEIDRILSRAMEDTHARRDKDIFWLYYRQGWSSRDISMIPAVGLTQSA